MEVGCVEARIRFVKEIWKRTPGIPRIDSPEERRANTDFQSVRIRDARPLHERHELGLDTNGFILVEHETAVRDFSRRADIESTYLPEMCALVGQLTGAAAVLPVNYLIRSEKPVSETDWFGAYARYVHLDYNVPWALETMRQELVRNGYHDAARGQDFKFIDPLEQPPYDLAIYGCWQPIEREVQRNPLTLMDARSLEDDDLVDYVIGGSVGGLPVHRPGQRFYYFPSMQTGEVIVFKHMDTRAGRARWCPHTSFDDPTGPPSPLGRRTIESRLVAVFGPTAPKPGA